MPYLIALALLAAALAWFFLGGRQAPGPAAPRPPRDDVDYQELEEAEREVREADDEDSVRDWGPGVPRPPHGL
ncbi:MAG TPA: hypothetical protein VNI61_11660 [Gemmatimonadales bacterium]|nr:hypothetical protein [Gemmatimonadales bacterium]